MQALDLPPLHLKSFENCHCSSLVETETALRKADLLGRVSISAARLLKGFDEEIKLEEVPGRDGRLGAWHLIISAYGTCNTFTLHVLCIRP